MRLLLFGTFGIISVIIIIFLLISKQKKCKSNQIECGTKCIDASTQKCINSLPCSIDKVCKDKTGKTDICCSGSCVSHDGVKKCCQEEDVCYASDGKTQVCCLGSDICISDSTGVKKCCTNPCINKSDPSQKSCCGKDMVCTQK